MNYSLSPTSTAREGIDFETIPRSVTFPANADEVRLPVNVIADGLPEGTESIVLELSSACSCSSTLSRLNIRDADPMEVRLDPLFLCEDEEGTLTPQVSGGLAPYSYVWSSGSNSVSLTGEAYICNGEVQGDLRVTYSEGGSWDLLYSINGALQPTLNLDRSPFPLPISIPGIYRLELVRRGNCEGSVSGSAAVDLLRLNARVETAAPTCPNADDARIEVLIEEGEGPFRYRINQQDFQNEAQFSNLSPGLYQVEVEDANGCTWNEQVRIQEQSSPQVSLVFEVEGCEGNQRGSVHVNIMSGSDTYEFSLDGTSFQAEPNFSSLSVQESYTLWIRDQQDCLQSIPFVIPVPEQLRVEVIEQDLSCPMAVDGQVILLANGGLPPYTYQQADGVTQTSNTFSDFPAGTYAFTIRDARGCEVVVQAGIEVPAGLAISDVIITEPSCPGSEDGAAQIEVTGGTGNRIYRWSNGATSAALENVIAGEYSVTITDRRECELIYSLTIPGEPWPGRLIQGSSSICAGSSIRLSGPEGDFAYSWSTGSTSEETWIDQAGTYSLTVTNVEGCRRTEDFTVSLSSSLSPSISGPSTFCEGETVELSVGDYDTYSWSTGATSASIDISTGGWYAVSVSSGADCFGTDSVWVERQAQPTAVILGETILCVGQSQMLSISEEMSAYRWSTGASEKEILNTGPGIYKVTVTDDFGCQGEDIIEVSEVPPAIRQSTQSICVGDSLEWNGQTLADPGQYQHTFSGMASNGCDSIEILQLQVFTASNSLEVIRISGWDQLHWQGRVLSESGFYQDTLPAANQFGCDSVMQLQLTVIPVQMDTSLQSLCAGDSLWIFDEWITEGGMVQDTFQSVQGLDSLLVTTFVEIHPVYHEIIPVSLCTGESWQGEVYTVDTSLVLPFNSATGCDSVIQYDLSISPIYDLMDSVTICQGDSLFFAGDWQRSTGVYMEEWQSAEGCDSTISLHLTIDPCPFTWTPTIYPIRCAGEANGRISVAIEDGVGPFAFLLMSEEGQRLRQVSDLRERVYEFSNLAAGMYHLRLWDMHTSYEEEMDIEITTPDPLILETLAEFPVSCFAGEDGAIEVQARGGEAPYFYQWSNGDTTSFLQDIAAGAYALTLSDQNACMEVKNFVLTEPIQLKAEGRFVPSWCEDGSGLLYIEKAFGGSPPYLFGAETYFIADTVQGYNRWPSKVFIQDVNGCQEELSVTHEPMPVPEIEIPQTQIQLGDTVQLKLVGPSNYRSLLWSPAANLSCDTCATTVAFPPRSTLYQLVLTDLLGCEVREEIWVQVDTRARIYAPNAFSPNGDTQNDRFTIYGGPEVERINQLSIFDRWGSLLFRIEKIPPNDPSVGWDGVVRGELASSGTYVYVAEVQLSNGRTKMIKGELMLMR